MKWYEAAAGAVGAAALIAAGLAIPAAGAQASDVTVDATGITLPAGDTFVDGGTIADSGSQGTFGYTFDSDCITSDTGSCEGITHELAQYIGSDSLPWSALGLSGDFCVTWVNLSLYGDLIYTGTQDSRCTGEGSGELGTDPTGAVLDTSEASPSASATEETDVLAATAATAADGDATYTG